MTSIKISHPLNTQNLAVCRYGIRHWAVYHGSEIIAVTVYKKGAMRVLQLLTETREAWPKHTESNKQ